MLIEIQCMTEKLIVITIKLNYSKVPSKSTVPTYACDTQAYPMWVSFTILRGDILNGKSP